MKYSSISVSNTISITKLIGSTCQRLPNISVI